MRLLVRSSLRRPYAHRLAREASGEDWRLAARAMLDPIQASLTKDVTTALATFQRRVSGVVATGQGLFAAGVSPAAGWVLAPAAQGGRVEDEEGLARAKDLAGLERLRGELAARLAAHAAEARRRVSCAQGEVARVMAEAEKAQEGMGRRVASLQARVAEKEIQRQHLLALHHAEHAGYMRVGISTTRARHRGARALFQHPKLWCVLRSDLLLCYDRPHSLQLEYSLPLRDSILKDWVPVNLKSTRNYRRVYALSWEGRDEAHGKGYVLVCDTEEDLNGWKAAMESFLTPTLSPTPSGLTVGPGGQTPTRGTPTPSTASTPQSQAGAGKRRSVNFRLGLLSRTPGPGKGHKPKRSFGFSPGRLALPRFKMMHGHSKSTGDDPTSSSRLSLTDSPLGSPRQEVGRLRQLEVTVRGVTASAWDGTTTPTASSGLGGPPACYVIASLEPHPGRGSIRPRGLSSIVDSVRAGSRRVTQSEPEQPAPYLMSARSDDSGGGMGGAREYCAARTWAELLSFHGLYLEKWMQAVEKAEAYGQVKSPGTRVAFCAAPFTGMSDMDALSYANQLVIGSQKSLAAYGSTEAERRHQVRGVCRRVRPARKSARSEELVRET